MNPGEELVDLVVAGGDSQSPAAGSDSRSTFCFGLLLLLFFQTLTVWLESIYRIGLTKLSMGVESVGLIFVLAPLLLLAFPARWDRTLLRISVVLFLLARALVPVAGVRFGAAVAGVGTGAFLVALCFMLSGKFRCQAGDSGVALGLAILGSIGLRSWGATYDFTLAPSGAVIGWLMVGVALVMLWSRISAERFDVSARQGMRGIAFGPVIGLFANFTVVYLVLSSPGVVEAWLGFDNTWGPGLCIFALGGVVIVLLRGLEISRGWLVAWNLLFALALVGGILALRIDFPAMPKSAAVVVRPENHLAGGLLNLMFILSPVVLMNVRVACRSLMGTTTARGLAVPMALGGLMLVCLTIMSIFTIVWGYVGVFSGVFRNQFHLPFLGTALLMVLALLLPGRQQTFWRSRRCPVNRMFGGLTLVLAGFGMAGTWWHRPPSAARASTAREITVLTYNLQQGSDMYGNRNWEKQLAFLRAVEADIVGLQESDTARPSGGNVAAAKFFGAKLGYHYYYGPNTVSGTYGTAILSRFPLKNPRSFFTFSEQDEVGTAVAEFEVNGETIAFINSHPSGKISEKRQAEELVLQLAPYAHVIAAGDYNAQPGDESHRIISARLRESWNEKHPDGVGELHPTLRPRSGTRLHASSGEILGSGNRITLPGRIDHIFVSKSFRVAEAYYLPAPDSQTDHPAHWAVLTWASGEAQRKAEEK